MELAFAGLHQLCAPMLGYRDRIPGPQSDAVGDGVRSEPRGSHPTGSSSAWPSSACSPKSRRRSRSSASSTTRSGSTTLLRFARLRSWRARLLAERVAFVFATRNAGTDDVFARLPELDVGGLADEDARLLLTSAVTGPVDEQVRDRIVAERAANRRAAAAVSRIDARRSSRADTASPRSCRSPIASKTDSSASCSRFLPEPADSSSPPPSNRQATSRLLWRALDGLGVAADAVVPAEAAGLIDLGTRVRFRHSLARSAVCRAAAPGELEDAHRTLAAATDAQRDPDRRVGIARMRPPDLTRMSPRELERSADRAREPWRRSRSGCISDPRNGIDTRFRAARCASRGGREGEVLRRRRTTRCRFFSPRQPPVRSTRTYAPGVSGCVRCCALTAGRAHDVSAELLDVVRRSWLRSTRISHERRSSMRSRSRRSPGVSGTLTRHAGSRTLFVPRCLHQTSRDRFDLLLDGLATRFADGYEAGVTPLRRALRARAGADAPAQQDLPGLILASTVSPALWDDEGWELLSGRVVLAARATGALYALPTALNYQASAHVNGAEFAAASALLDEADVMSDAIGHQRVLLSAPEVAAWQGSEARTMELVEASIEAATARRFGRPISVAHHARAVLFNGVGRYPEALAAAELACEHEDHYHYGRSLSELVEAGVRSRDPDAATVAFDRLAERTGAAGTDWAQGIEARSRGAAERGARRPESLYREAVERLGRTRIGRELARAHLLYGEWLRRESRRVDAREQLRDRLRDVHPLRRRRVRRARPARAARDRREGAQAAATSTRPAHRAGGADRAAGCDRQTNPEIGAQLFLSPRTVEWHLHKVFTKLGVGSRMQLRDKLPDAARTGAPALAAGRRPGKRPGSLTGATGAPDAATGP